MDVSFQIDSVLTQLESKDHPHCHRGKQKYRPMMVKHLLELLGYRFLSLILRVVKMFGCCVCLFVALLYRHIKRCYIFCCILELQTAYRQLIYKLTLNCL